MPEISRILKITITNAELTEIFRSAAIAAVEAEGSADQSEIDDLATANVLFRDTADGRKAIILDTVLTVEPVA